MPAFTLRCHYFFRPPRCAEIVLKLIGTFGKSSSFSADLPLLSVRWRRRPIAALLPRSTAHSQCACKSSSFRHRPDPPNSATWPLAVPLIKSVRNKTVTEGMHVPRQPQPLQHPLEILKQTPIRELVIPQGIANRRHRRENLPPPPL